MPRLDITECICYITDDEYMRVWSIAIVRRSERGGWTGIRPLGVWRRRALVVGKVEACSDGCDVHLLVKVYLQLRSPQDPRASSPRDDCAFVNLSQELRIGLLACAK